MQYVKWRRNAKVNTFSLLHHDAGIHADRRGRTQCGVYYPSRLAVYRNEPNSRVCENCKNAAPKEDTDAEPDPEEAV